MFKKLSSSVLKEYVSMIVGKDIDLLTSDDLENIKSISLKKRNFNDEETDCTVNDLIEFKNLTFCTLCEFNIDNETIDIINRMKKLEFIHFDFCNFVTERIDLNQKVEAVCFNMCDGLNLRKMENTLLQSIEIIGNIEKMYELDVSDFIMSENLKELYIHNYNIKNIEKILEVAPNLEILNIDGSKVEEGKLQSLMQKIEISHEDVYCLGEEPV